MRRLSFACAALGVWIGMAGVTAGQADPAGQHDIAQMLEELSKRIDALETRHESDQHRIAELEARLERIERPITDDERAREIEKITEAVKSELGELRASTGLFDLSMSGFGAGNELNPQITIFFDGGASVSSRGSNKALNRFNLREVELDFRAAISPSADGVVILTLEEEIEQDPSGDIDTDRNVDIEEAYINFHSLPHDLSLKIGKFRNVFGVNNVLHTHDL
ncbi:MAG: hypothetical protein IID43_00860, partial [Planctomycetes bacterium]|nr:hypothetical protein [Planctomycetota bacterium]